MTTILTNEHIGELIECPKNIVKTPLSEDKPDMQHFKNDMRLLSTDKKYAFKVFFRRHQKIVENFSIGLIYISALDGHELMLLRCNSKHKNPFWKHHQKCHVHMLTTEDMENGITNPAEILVENEYNTYEEAVAFFLKRCGVLDTCNYLDKFRQRRLC